MPKKLTKELQSKLESNANLLAEQGASESEIQEMAFAFVEQFGVDESSEKKNSENGSLVESQSQSTPISPAPNGQSQSQKGFVESLKDFYRTPQEKTSFEEKVTSQKGINLLRGGSIKPIEVQGKIKEKKRDSKGVIDYATQKLASTFSKGDKDLESKLTTTIEEGLKSGGYNEVYDFYEEKKDSEDFVKNSTSNDIVERVSQKTNSFKNNPQELSIYQTSKEAKIGKLITDIQEGKKIGERDSEYLRQNAPIAYKDMLRGVEQYSTNYPIQNINTVAEINKRRNDANRQLGGAQYIQQSVDAFAPLINEESLGLGLMNSKLVDIKKRYDDGLKKLDAKYPIETYQVRTADGYDTRIKPQPTEYLKAKEQLEGKKNELLSKAGQLEAVYYGKRSESPNAKDIGLKFVQVSSPNMYSLYTQAVNSKGFEADITKMGIDLMINSGDPRLIAQGKIEEQGFNDKYPEWRERDLLRRMAVEHYKGEGVSTIVNKGRIEIKRADDLIEQFPDKDRDFYFKYVRPKYNDISKVPTISLGGGIPNQDMRGIPIPNAGGFFNKFLEGYMMPIKGTANLIGNLLESEQSKAQRALAPQNITEQELFAKDNINKEIDTLIKKDKLNAYEAKRLSELYTEQSLKSDTQRWVDGSALVLGQVVSQGTFGNALGGVTGAMLSRAGNVAKGLGYIGQAERLATIASNLNAVNNFGNATFAFLSTYDDASLEVERLAPDANPLFKTAYATSVGLLNAGTEQIFRDAKIFDAFKREVAPEIASLVSNLSTGSITEEVFRNQVSTLMKNTLPKYIGNVVKEDVKEGIEEATTEAGSLITKLVGVAIGEIDPEQVNVEEGIDAIGQVFQQTVVDGLLVAGLGGRTESLKSRTTQRALYELAKDPNKFIDLVGIQQNEGKMSIEDATEKIKIARTLNEVATKTIPALEKRITLNDNQKIALTTLLTLEKKLEHDLGNPQNKGIASVIESQLASIRNKKDGILKGEYVVDENFNALTPDELKQKVEEEKQKDLELQKSFSKVNTNPQFALITEADGSFSVMNNDKKEEGFKTKEDAQRRILELNGLTYTPPQTEIGEQIEISVKGLQSPNIIQNETAPTKETIEATDTEVATSIGQQPSNAPIQEANAESTPQSEIGIHESTKGVMNGMNVTIERKDDGNYIYTMLRDKIPFTKEQHDELVASKELIITKGKEIAKQPISSSGEKGKVEQQQPTTSSESESKTTDQIYSDNAKKAFIEGRINAFTMDENELYLNTNGVRVINGFKDNGNMDVFEASKVELTKEEKREFKQIEADREFGDEGTGERKKELAKKIFKRSLSEQSKLETTNEGTGTKEISSEPIQPKGSSKGKGKEGVGEAVQQGTKGTDNAVAGTTTSVLGESNPALKDVESTAKALDDKYWENKKEGNIEQLEIYDLIPKEQIENPNKNGFYRISKMDDEWVLKQSKASQDSIKKLNNIFIDRYKHEVIAEAYHKSKKDGTNPELVKAVEELLKEQPKAETPKQNIKQNEKQQSNKNTLSLPNYKQLLKILENDPIKRLSQEDEQSRKESGGINEVATIITGAVHKAVQEEQGISNPNAYRKIKQLEEVALEKYATENNLMIALPSTEIIGNGNESDVYLSENDNEVIKVNNANNNNSWLEFMDSIAIHNTENPNTKYTIEGFTRNKDGEFSVVLRQEKIIGIHPKFDKIHNDLLRKGYELYGEYGDGSYVNKSTNIVIEDVKEDNVIEDESGNLHYIDTDYYPFTKQKGGDLTIEIPVLNLGSSETNDIRYSAKEDNNQVSKSISKLSELSNKIDNAQTTSEARKAKEDYDNELKKGPKLNFIITNFTSITDQLEKLKLITKKGDC